VAPEKDVLSAGGARCALVTGASYGLGAATALALARDGCDVAVTELRVADLADTVARIEAAGRRALPLPLDLRTPDSIDAVFDRVTEHFGHLDVLVNNAGTPLRRYAVDVTRDEWQTVIDVNLSGAFFMSQRMARQLIAARRPGCIVSIASTFGVTGFPERSTYGIAKAGVSHMARMLAIEWAEHGIRVNAVAPGTVETPQRAAGFAAEPGRRQAMIGRVPLKRFGTPEEVGALVAWLAGPQAAYITGQTVLLDGGLTAY
jgi:NAD(P)-dependent dehydrogenase (short-subunit alcohol dehydrogenase family)